VDQVAVHLVRAHTLANVLVDQVPPVKVMLVAVSTTVQVLEAEGLAEAVLGLLVPPLQQIQVNQVVLVVLG
jgi:hypothetical protein